MTKKQADTESLFKTIYGAMITPSDLTDEEVATIAQHCVDKFKKEYSIS